MQMQGPVPAKAKNHGELTGKKSSREEEEEQEAATWPWPWPIVAPC